MFTPTDDYGFQLETSKKSAGKKPAESSVAVVLLITGNGFEALTKQNIFHYFVELFDEIGLRAQPHPIMNKILAWNVRGLNMAKINNLRYFVLSLTIILACLVS